MLRTKSVETGINAVSNRNARRIGAELEEKATEKRLVEANENSKSENSGSGWKRWNQEFASCAKPGRKRLSLTTCESFAVCRNGWQNCSEEAVTGVLTENSESDRRLNCASSLRKWNDKSTNCAKPARKRPSLTTCVSFAVFRDGWQNCSEGAVIDGPKGNSESDRRPNCASSSKKWNDRSANSGKPGRAMRLSNMYVSSIDSKSVLKACDETAIHGKLRLAGTDIVKCR